MSDDQPGQAPPNPNPGASLPPPPPPPPPPPAQGTPEPGATPPAAPTTETPAVELEGADAPKKRSARGRVLAGVAAVAVVAVGAAVTVKLVSSQSSGGAATPEQAVENMVGALEDNDLLGVVDVLAPWERDFARDQIDNYLDDAKRNEWLAKDADLANFGGYKLAVEGLEVKAEEVNERIANVSIVGGTARFQSELNELPLGAKLLEQLDKADDGRRPEDVDETADLSEAQLGPLTTIKQGGRWYVSIFYTAAEAARARADAPAPTTEQAIHAKGAESPEAAVDDLIDALERGDVRRLIELAPPDEMAVLHDYAPLFLDEVKASGERIVKFTDREYDLMNVDGGKKVIPTKFKVELAGERPGTLSYDRTGDHVQVVVEREGETTTIRVEKADNGSSFVLSGSGTDLRGTITSEGESTVKITVKGTSEDEAFAADLTLTPEGACVNVKGEATSDGQSEYVDEQVCPEDIFGSENAKVPGIDVEKLMSLDKLGKLVQFEQLSRVFDLGIVTVKVDGDWYVSPLRTGAELLGMVAHVTEGI